LRRDSIAMTSEVRIVMVRSSIWDYTSMKLVFASIGM